MILVLGVMAILFTVGAQTFINERNRFEFNNALTKTMQLVKTVRNYATTSFPVYIKDVGNVIPKGGYGIFIHLDKARGASTIKVFANLGAAPNFQEDDGKNKFDGPTVDQVLETYTLPRQIDFRYFWFTYYDVNNQLQTDKKWRNKTDTEPAGPTAFDATIIFKPPQGDMVINDNASQNLTELGLEFQNPASDSTGPKKCQRIIINQVKQFPELMYEPQC